MKPTYLIPFLAIALSGYAQTTNKSDKANPDEKGNVQNIEPVPPSENSVYNAVGLQVQPEFPGGISAFGEFIRANFNTPTAEDGPKTVKAYISFIVEKDGSVTDIKILKDPGYGIGDEAKRVLKLSPKWKPGIQSDVAVRTSFTLPLSLNLERPATSKKKNRG